MERAIGETDRRREKQVAHNKKHNITPVGVVKSVEDILDAGAIPGSKGKKHTRGNERKVAEPSGDYLVDAQAMTPSELGKLLKKLEQQMQQHAKNLEFEAAANVRDKLSEIKQRFFTTH
jgi:excinuclease ABC subunit B